MCPKSRYLAAEDKQKMRETTDLDVPYCIQDHLYIGDEDECSALETVLLPVAARLAAIAAGNAKRLA